MTLIKSEPKLAVSEIFGPTIQGEGPTVGKPSFFLRLAGCNLSCKWCDTKYTWDWANYEKSKHVTVLGEGEVIRHIHSLRRDNPYIKNLVITGGEPMLQQASLENLIRIATLSWGFSIEIETAGTIKPSPAMLDMVTKFNVSPKIGNSDNNLAKLYSFYPNLSYYSSISPYYKSIFKFVVEDEKDFNEICTIVSKLNIRNEQIFISPQGTDLDSIISKTHRMLPGILGKGWNLSTRYHIVLWGNVRGV